MSGGDKDRFTDAVTHLSKSDPVLAGLIVGIGECTLGRTEDYHLSLVGSIINQQLSGSAADSIYGRLLSEAGGDLSPEGIYSLFPEQFRRTGVSRSKEDYIRRISALFSENADFLRDLDERTDQEILSILTGIKGVGRWTAQMFMIFSLNRLDVLPLDDAGFRRAVSRFYLNGRPALDEDILKISGNGGHTGA